MRESLTKLALAYAQRLVRIESVTFHERRCAEELGRILRGLDFDVDIDEGNNLVARLPGTHSGAPSLLFIGHHDTVALGDLSEWEYPPLDAVVADGKLHGRGSNDEKGGLAAFLAAAEYRKARGLRPRGDLLLVSTREETADFDQRGILQILHRGLSASACICLEPTASRIMLGHRGRAVTDFTVRGRAAHAGMPARGVNAIAGMASLIDALQAMPLPGAAGTASPDGGAPAGHTGSPADLPASWPPQADWAGTQTVTTIRGGTAENIVPEECSITVDRRILEGEDEHTLAAEYQAVIDTLQMPAPDMSPTGRQRAGVRPSDQLRPDFRIDFQIRRPYYAALTDREDGFVQSVREICGDMGICDEPAVFPGHTDAEWIINDMGIPCVIFGPGNLETAHTAGEYVPVEELGICAELYYRVATGFGE